MPEFAFQDILPLGPDDTSYRLLTTVGVSTFAADGRRFLRVDPSALTLLTAEAMRDIAHYLRPAHLQQLRKILDDPDASSNDRFVALDLLKNACIAAGGVLPMCQDTGTAIVMGKKGEYVIMSDDDFARLVASLREDLDVTVVLVEHDMTVVGEIADWVYVLDFGKIIAADSPGRVRRNRLVIDRYLGEVHAASA